MILSSMVDLRPALLLTLLVTIEIVNTLKDVRVSVPAAIRHGDNANLICHYDMEGAVLYSVKWYKGKREFFRYTPKENPALKAFPVLGIMVERSQSNGSHLTLTAVEPTMSGKYSCEVSADSPSFHTMIVSSEMEVVDVPTTKPHITGIRPHYRVGDLLAGNCTSHNSKPAANLTWFVNSNEVNQKQTVPYHVWKNTETGLETSTLGLHFHINHHHTGRGKLKFTCVAKIYNIYEQRTERYVEDEQPNTFASVSPVGLSVNYIHSLYDQFPASSYHHHDHSGGGGDFDNQTAMPT
ncbi:LOW QUALITY PROTEIN: cell adhesion molecule 2-like [Malaya genurostris]|uniref:LOW QUALITY PROTEIN: cell adhesion molecule 2-like n=1 Tax=Malaya genurostris TaxID=325434 RepID=UPI0026F3B5EA|nr:LOW QUALITY PROTEIN: cell adhesion molecule 2-like [Malaya genurostris]